MKIQLEYNPVRPGFYNLQDPQKAITHVIFRMDPNTTYTTRNMNEIQKVQTLYQGYCEAPGLSVIKTLELFASMKPQDNGNNLNYTYYDEENNFYLSYMGDNHIRLGVHEIFLLPSVVILPKLKRFLAKVGLLEYCDCPSDCPTEHVDFVIRHVLTAIRVQASNIFLV